MPTNAGIFSMINREETYHAYTHELGYTVHDAAFIMVVMQYAYFVQEAAK